VLAVVEDQQQLLPGQVRAQRFHDRHPGGLAQPEHCGHRGGHQSRLGHRGQLHAPDAVGEAVRYLPGDLIGQPRLAHPARPGHRHQPVLTEQPGHRVHGAGPADETGERRPHAVQSLRWLAGRVHRHASHDTS